MLWSNLFSIVSNETKTRLNRISILDKFLDDDNDDQKASNDTITLSSFNKKKKVLQDLSDEDQDEVGSKMPIKGKKNAKKKKKKQATSSQEEDCSSEEASASSSEHESSSESEMDEDDRKRDRDTEDDDDKDGSDLDETPQRRRLKKMNRKSKLLFSQEGEEEVRLPPEVSSFRKLAIEAGYNPDDPLDHEFLI